VGNAEVKKDDFHQLPIPLKVNAQNERIFDSFEFVHMDKNLRS
jgi:hypothetical protein